MISNITSDSEKCPHHQSTIFFIPKWEKPSLARSCILSSKLNHTDGDLI